MKKTLIIILLFLLVSLGTIAVGITIWDGMKTIFPSLQEKFEYGKGGNPNMVILTSTSSDDHTWLGTSQSAPMILGTSTTGGMQDPIDGIAHMGGASSLCMNVWWTPSTTDAILDAKYYASDDGTNWYAIDSTNNVASTTVAEYNTVTTTIHLFPPAGATDTRSKYVCPAELQNLNTKYVKVRFIRGTNLSGGKIYVEGIKSKN